MARRNHPNQKFSGLWRPSDKDKHDPATLDKMRDFFEEDLELAKQYRRSIQKYAKLKSFAEIDARAKKDIGTSEANLALVNRLIVAAHS